LNGTGTPQDLTPVGLVRATLVAAQLLGGRAASASERSVETAGPVAHVVAAPLPAHGDAAYDHELGMLVAGNYATGDVLAVTGEGEWPDEVAAVVDQDQPDDDERGFVVFFTGLSGSGKSTLARALHDLILEDGRRTVTSLDGDVVRRNLSKGLTFSKEDRETNIRRIGWVAAEIARHRGIAICSPIAPFDTTRKQVRQMVEDAGGVFVLVHVSTPLEECERRDRKGLYAKARAGEIPEFTGISSPYDEPTDAAVHIDTTGRTIEDCLEDLMPVLPFHHHLGG
ncbi:MAG: adenylyl-sulfate kinase, partial [Marmoricola sp.]